MNRSPHMPTSKSIQSISIETTVEEVAHQEAALEWWFVQGWFKDKSSGPRHFMMAFFQQQAQSSLNDRLVGHMLLVSHLDPATAQHWFRSQISPGVSDLLFHYQKEMKTANFDKDMVDTLLDEIWAYGPPHPVTEETSPVKSAIDRLDVVWADAAITQTEEDFVFQYDSPEDGQPCRLILSPRTSRIFYELDVEHEETMAYASIPRLTLVGKIGKEPVTGEAWFDHQWGEYAWFATGDRNRRILGWDWFGINLDDGTDLLLLIHRDMQDQSILARHAIYITAEGQSRKLTWFSARPTTIWESPKTHCRYPLAWQMDLPEIDTFLTIEPLAYDQELALFGIMRTLWEGACVAKGTKQGRPVSGKARLELHGYGYIFDFRTYLDRWVTRIDNHIRDFLPPVMDAASLASFVGADNQHDLQALTTMLNTPIWDMMQRGGKRWRPVFGFLLLDALGKSYFPFEQLIAAVTELCHLGSLIIDDIEDQSLMRRGEESVYLRYGTDLAINAANTLYFLPFLLLENHKDLSVAQREHIYQVMIRQFVRTHFGQGMDIYWSKFTSSENLEQWLDDSLAAKVLDMYADKTAAPIVGGAQVACIIAEADDPTRHACIEFALAFGVAFQIMDDVLNFSRSDKWTKTVGEDLAAGKLTYVIIKTLQATCGEAHKTLYRLICDEGYRRQKNHFEMGVRIIRESGALETCREHAQAMVRERWAELSKHLQPSEAKVMLRLLCTKLTDLTFV